MIRVLVLYFTRGGHTAKIASAIADQLILRGVQVDLIDINSAAAKSINWSDYQAVALGACVLYGSYDKSVFQFIEQHARALDALPNSFFCVNVVARNPEKRIPENNKYLQKFITLSPWTPADLKIIAGKVDYPSWPWYDRWMIQLIMKMTKGPTDPKSVIDYTDWEDVKVYADHLLELAQVNTAA
ncbi:menaquinone-dependent protoporphyrinogen IX dehydrogenase [Shewanella glacialipiscicola]|uniref:menaquinone-dependent protoporphyrinogen IX dehydrogenase n=1 Tax=Shewanella glacialipiscicola TaxID=614069 RepID=UPI003D7AD3A9